MELFLNYNINNDTLSVGSSDLDKVTVFESFEYKKDDKYKGWLSVGNSEFKFNIEANFKYKPKLSFAVKYKGEDLFPFQDIYDKPKGTLLNEYGFEPKPDNWSALLELLCEVYKYRNSWNVNQCLKWIEARIKKDVIESPIKLAKSLKDYLSTIKMCHIETCTPVMDGTNAILERELPVLTKNLLAKSDTPVIKQYTKDAIKSAFDYFVTNDHVESFIRGVQHRE